MPRSVSLLGPVAGLAALEALVVVSLRSGVVLAPLNLDASAEDPPAITVAEGLPCIFMVGELNKAKLLLDDPDGLDLSIGAEQLLEVSLICIVVEVADV